MKGTIRKIKGQTVYIIDGKVVSEKDFNRLMDEVRYGAGRPERGTFAEGVAGKADKKRRKRGYPIKSIALECHPDSIAGEQAKLAKRGVQVDYTPQGQPILRDAGHRKAVLKALGLHDRNSFTGY